MQVFPVLLSHLVMLPTKYTLLKIVTQKYYNSTVILYTDNLYKICYLNQLIISYFVIKDKPHKRVGLYFL